MNSSYFHINKINDIFCILQESGSVHPEMVCQVLLVVNNLEPSA